MPRRSSQHKKTQVPLVIAATKTRTGAVVIAGALACACGSNGEPLPERPKCAYDEQEITFEDESPLGFSAASRLTPLLGKRECVWSWNGPGKAGDMYPPPNQVAAHVSLAYAGGSVRFVAGARVGGDSAIALHCPSRVTVVANLSLKTEDQALDVVLPVPLELTGAGALAELDITVIDLGGDYAFTWSKKWPTSSRVLKTLASSNGWVEGQLYEQAQQEPTHAGEVTSIEGVVFRAADWTCSPPTL